MTDAFFEVGRALSARGLAGELRLRLYRPFPPYFECGRIWLGRALSDRKLYQIQSLQWQDERTAVVRLAHVGTRDEAEALIGSTAWVEPAWLDGDEIAPDMLLGARVEDDASGEDIGVVAEVFHNGAHWVLALGEGAEEKLVPFVDAFIRGVSEDRPPVIRLAVLPGLLD